MSKAMFVVKVDVVYNVVEVGASNVLAQMLDTNSPSVLS